MFTTKEGYDAKCVEYTKYSDIVVELDNGCKISTNWGNFVKGEVKNPYHRSIFGVGFIGVGDFKCTINGKTTKEYETWRGMLRRCYSKELHDKFISYKGCSVVPEWHNFQVFCGWYNDNYYDLQEKVDLDKDIINKGNKVYSPDNCVFAPSRINTCVIKCDVQRGELPIGVVKRDKMFEAKISVEGKREYLGLYKTPEEAFLAYKEAKEQYIKKIALEYKYKIPTRLFVALMNYEVEITD